MYAETGLMFPYFQNFQQFDGFCCSEKPNASMVMPSSLIQTSTISDYNLGVDGDLFKAPEPVIEESLMSLDPMTAALFSCGEADISTQSLTVLDIESSIENGKILSEVFYECRKDLLAKDRNETPLSEVLNIRNPRVKNDENLIIDGNSLDEGPSQKCVSSSCLSSVRPNFLDFPVMDFDVVTGMRRAFSEGDIKTLCNGNVNLQPNQSPMEQPIIMSSCIPEDRTEKLLRYRIKRSKRNFGRKIKYACRKALADSQPRIHGRFAKTEEPESSKK